MVENNTECGSKNMLKDRSIQDMDKITSRTVIIKRNRFIEARGRTADEDLETIDQHRTRPKLSSTN